MPGPNENIEDTENSNTQVQDNAPQDNGGTENLLTNFMRETDGPPRQSGQEDGTRQSVENTQQDGATNKGTPQARAQGDSAQQQPSARGQSNDQSRTVQQVPQAARQYGNLFLADTRGDIYDARGNLVAKQGYGRSIFHKLYPYIEATATENASLKQRVDNFERANQIAKDNGLTLDDYGAGMQLMVQWKKNPLETLNTLLKVATDRGIDVSSIRGGGGLDPSALRSTVAELLQEHLKPFQPFVENQQRRQEEEEANAHIINEYNAFMIEYPDAIPHQMSMANLMRDHNMSHREAYFALRAIAGQYQLDFSQDLKPQLDALEAKRASNGQGTPSGSGNDRTLPNMGGRANGGGTVSAGSRNAGSPDESWDSIARRTFEQHGIRYE